MGASPQEPGANPNPNHNHNHNNSGLNPPALAPVTKSVENPLLTEGLSAYDMAWWNTYPSVMHRPDVGGPNGTFQLWYNGFASCGGNKVHHAHSDNGNLD